MYLANSGAHAGAAPPTAFQLYHITRPPLLRAHAQFTLCPTTAPTWSYCAKSVEVPFSDNKYSWVNSFYRKPALKLLLKHIM